MRGKKGAPKAVNSKRKPRTSKPKSPNQVSEVSVEKVVRNVGKKLVEDSPSLPNPIIDNQLFEEKITRSKVTRRQTRASQKSVSEPPVRRKRSTKNGGKNEVGKFELPDLSEFEEIPPNHGTVLIEKSQNSQMKCLVVKLSKVLPSREEQGAEVLGEGKDKTSSTTENGSLGRNEMKIIISESEITYKNIYSTSKFPLEEYETRSEESQETFSSQVPALLKTPLEIARLSDCSSFSYLDDNSVFNELIDVPLDDLEPAYDGISDEELKLKLEETFSKKKFEGSSTKEGTLGQSQDTGKDYDDHSLSICPISNIRNFSLQSLIENFINGPQFKFCAEVNALKSGLCPYWLNNNYRCDSQYCNYSHNAFKLFTNKLKKYSSDRVMILAVSMRDDTLFVDALMAAFKVLSFREFPDTWVTMLVFFVFYVTEPSDCRFLKFWCNTARFFFYLNEEYTAANGFAKLLSIFSQCHKSEEWKIIEFVKMVKKPPIQFGITYILLQPILNIDLPVEFLMEAVESSLNNQVHIVDVYKNLIPKVPIMTLSTPDVELLLRFCQTLYKMNQKFYADDLKSKLSLKVQSLKVKCKERGSPLAISYQKELNTNGEDSMSASSSTDNFKGIYFEPRITSYINTPESVECDSIFGSVDKSTESSSFSNIKNDVGQKRIGRESHLKQIQQLFRKYQFNLLGKYMNNIQQDVLFSAAEEIIKLLFHTRASLEDIVCLFKTWVALCETENAATILASIGITLIANLVNISEWDKAHTLYLLCEEKKINLLDGVVFVSKELNSLSQLRIALLLVEINIYQENYQNAIHWIKKYNLFSPKSSKWHLLWKSNEEDIRVRILEMFLTELAFRHTTDVLYDLFFCIWKEQTYFHEPVDLRKFSNEVMTLLLNQDSKEAVRLYEDIGSKVRLSDVVVRGILVTLVRHKYFDSAKNLLLRLPSIYSLPSVISSSLSITLSNLWLEEEIYVMFDTLFEKLISAYLRNDCLSSEPILDFEVFINITTESITTSPDVPVCLNLVDPSLDQACIRIKRVLQYQFFPSINCTITLKSLKLDPHSIKQYILSRVNCTSDYGCVSITF